MVNDVIVRCNFFISFSKAEKAGSAACGVLAFDH